MSRIAKNPIPVPQGVEVNIDKQTVSVKGPKGQLTHQLHGLVTLEQVDQTLKVGSKEVGRMSRSEVAKKDAVSALTGTTRAVVNNMVVGVTQGFMKKLLLVGVGYRAQAQGKKLVLSLGFSHPVNYELPEGITVNIPTQTEIELSGVDKQVVGQVAAEIRAFRPPEPYKGKGVRYADETVQLKETKKK